jgi:putative N6-adenine-specific DNA methylase
MKQINTFIIPCLFGLESFVAQELRDLGFEAFSENGVVRCKTDFLGAARANMFLRCGERVLLLVGEYKAESFTQLFDGCKEIAWENYIPKGGAFPVKGHSLNSKLFSVSDCQSIIKKAVVERLRGVYRTDWFREDKEKYQIQFSIMKDVVRIMLDMSGEGLHKRGYRKVANAAPLRETLAAAMVKISRYRRGDVFLDPMCGSGTIAIEAALMGAKIAPGLNRSFSAERWTSLDSAIWDKAREEAKDLQEEETFTVDASDVSPKMVDLTLANAKLAGVSPHIRARVKDVGKIKTSLAGGIVVTNPPYGQRLLDLKEARQLYTVMGKTFLDLPDWNYYILSPDEAFEKYFGKVADKKRKLYNGMIKCDLYQYFRRKRHANV